MNTLPDDCVRTILSKLPRLEDMRALTDALHRSDMLGEALLSRIEAGGFTLTETVCQRCHSMRTVHGWPCHVCDRLLNPRPPSDSESESEWEPDSDSEESDDSSTADPTWVPE